MEAMVETTERAREFLNQRFEQMYQAAQEKIAPENVTYLDATIKFGEDLIGRISIIRPMDSKNLWNRFLQTFFVPGNPLTDILVSQLTSELVESFNTSYKLKQILSISEGLRYLQGGGILTDVAILEAIPTIDDLKDTLKYYIQNPDKDMVNFLREFIVIMNKKQLPKKSFLVLKEVNGKMIAIGAHIENGILQGIGITSLTAPCRQKAFSDLYHQASKKPSDLVLIHIRRTLSDSPEDLINPYKLPADLFILQSTTNPLWGPLNLTPSRIGQELEEYISS